MDIQQLLETATPGDVLALFAITVLTVVGAAFLRWAVKPWERYALLPEVRAAIDQLRGADAVEAKQFPTGWYVVLRAGDLPVRGVTDVVFCGRRVAVWRGADGKARAVDAFCAHLGANMGKGDVIGNQLRCPFHHWSYNGDGVCSSIPYAKPSCIPKDARVEAYHVIEQDDQIYLWYSHVAGQEPHWRPRVRNPAGYAYQANFNVDIRGKVRSITENSADVAHFQYVHANTWKGMWRRLFHTRWRVTQPYTTDGAFASISVDSICILCNTWHFVIPLRVLQMGPGVANISVKLPGGGRAEILQCALPGAKPDHTTLTERIYADTWFARFIAYFAMGEVLQDSKIWRYQLARDKPSLATVSAGEDTTDMILSQYRSWFTQFEDGGSGGGKGAAAADGAEDYAGGGPTEESPNLEW